jgi:hypothetical protein
MRHRYGSPVLLRGLREGYRRCCEFPITNLLIEVPQLLEFGRSWLQSRVSDFLELLFGRLWRRPYWNRRRNNNRNCTIYAHRNLTVFFQCIGYWKQSALVWISQCCRNGSYGIGIGIGRTNCCHVRRHMTRILKICRG